jgi:phage gpG-like protein
MAHLAISVEVTGEKKTERHLLGIGARVMDARPVLGAIAEQMRAAEQARFEAEGYGAWPPLKPSTVAYKAAQGLNPMILQATEALRRSLTEKGLDNIEFIGHDELIFGTADPKAIYHQYGTRFMPARPPVHFDEPQIRGFTREIQAYVMGLERADFGTQPYGLGSTIFGV